MEGYKRLLYVAERELERCNDLMDKARTEKDASDFSKYVRHAMACEDTRTFLIQKIKLNN